ncbi:MAG: sialidase family protein [Thermoguttaceae bacterium]
MILSNAPEPGEFAVTGERYKRRPLRHHMATPEKREREIFRCRMLRSADEGASRSRRYDCRVSSPHRPFLPRAGRILFPGHDHSPNVYLRVLQSTDDGLGWEWLGVISTRRGDNPIYYHALHGVDAPDGTLIVQIRNHNLNNLNETP